MNTDNIQYNTQKNHLVISEYGRNIQNMIYAVRDIEDDEKRQRLAEAIVDLMYQMNPSGRNNPEYKLKLWRHMFRIADYDLNVSPPEGDVPTPENTRITPKNIEYPSSVRKFRHYGQNVQILIEKAIAMTDDEKRSEFVMIIAAYMKLAYRTWNREHFVSDDVIKQDLYNMSGGKIQISEDDNIVVTAPMPSSNQHRRRQSKGGKKGRSNRSGSNRRGGGRKRR